MKIRLKATVYAGAPGKVGRRVPSVNRTLGVEIGSICCALRCPDDRLLRRLGGLYRNFLTERTPDITIDLEKVPNTKEVPGGDGTGLDFNVLVDRPDVYIAEMDCEPAESDAGFKCVNRLFYLAYYTACLEKYGGNPPAMLVHACGILRFGRAFVFTGPSESGKTTIAGMCGEKDGRVINDEMVMVSPRDGGGAASVRSVPIIGGFPPGINIAVPLSCILLLKKGSRTRVCPIEPVDSFLQFIRQIITPSYIGQQGLRTALSIVADFSQEITGSVPVYELEFTMDSGSLWREIEALEEKLYGRVMR